MRCLCAVIFALLAFTPARADILINQDFIYGSNTYAYSGTADLSVSLGPLAWSDYSFDQYGDETMRWSYNSGGSFAFDLLSGVDGSPFRVIGTTEWAYDVKTCLGVCGYPWDTHTTLTGALLITSASDSLGNNYLGSGTFDFEYGKALDDATVTLDLVPVPEPTALLLLASGLIPILWRRRH